MSKIGFGGITQLTPALDFAQNAGQQYVYRMRQGFAMPLLAGQTFLFPAGRWIVRAGRYTNVQWYDTTRGAWRDYDTQPPAGHYESDGTNLRLANTTGTPVGCVITNVGAGNATNGYNTIGITVSSGSSTWGTLVGGSLNMNVTLGTATGANGNYALAPLILWTPAGNQTTPYIAPSFTAAVAANGNITSITVRDQGAGLTAPGTLTAVQQPGDTNPGGANLTGVLGANLVNSGNLTAMWPLTPGTGLTAVPTFTFNLGGGLAATALMDWTVTGFTVTTAGANIGVSKRLVVISGNGLVAATANIQVGAANVGDRNRIFAAPRMAWLATTSEANGNLSSNANVLIQDAGKNIQAIPDLVTLVGNANGSGTNALPVLVAEVGGITDETYVQML